MDEYLSETLIVPTSETESSGERITYSADQQKFISDHYGIQTEPDSILVTRSQIDKTLPTAARSCCILSPQGQNSFYLDEGFVFSLPSDEIPWVKEGDAGTLVTSKIIDKPEGSITIAEYLSSKKPEGKYTETVIDFKYGIPTNLKAIYYFKELPEKPSRWLKIVNPKKYSQIEVDIRDISASRDEWRKTAEKYKVPFITTLPDRTLMENIRIEEKRIKDLPQLSLHTPLNAT